MEKVTTKEKIIRQSIAICEKKLSEINNLLNANPVSKICEIRIEAQKLLDENKTIEQRTSKDFILKIEELAKLEKEQFRIAKQSSNSIKLIDDKVELEMELTDLKNELYHIERNKNN